MFSPATRKGLARIILSKSAASLNGFLAHAGLEELGRQMVLRGVVAFIMHRGRMSCSAAAGSVASDPIHRGELTRFLARTRWQMHDFNSRLMQLLLAKETRRGKLMFLIDATLVSQAGRKENTPGSFRPTRNASMKDRPSTQARRGWESQRLHGLRHADRQQCTGHELKYLSERLKTAGVIAKLKRQLANALPTEYRAIS